MKSLKEILLIASLLIGALVLAKYTNIHSPVYRMPHHIPRKDANAPKEINGVPLTIYQSWGTHEIPHHMANNIKQVLEKNPEFDYYLYSDEECRMFIQHNFPADVVKAFDSLRPGAYKSDLWRYCILYKKGGVYMDIKMKPLVPLTNFIKSQPYVFVKDKELIETNYVQKKSSYGEIPKDRITMEDTEGFMLNPQGRMDECMWNGFMIAPPGFEIFKFCIEEIVQACKQKSYMRNPLDITGPCLLGRVVKKHDAQKFLYYNMLILTGPESIYWNTDKVFMKYSQYRAEQKQFQRSNHYDELWKTSRVYHE